MKGGFLTGLVLGVLAAAGMFVVWDTFVRDHPAQTVDTQYSDPDPGAATARARKPVAQVIPADTRREPMAVAAMWTVSDAPAADLPHRRIDVEEAGVLRFDRGTLARLRPGDMTTIVLPAPAHSVSLTVESVSTTPSGNRQIAGQLTGSHLHPFLVTLSGGGMHATVGTRVGTYNLRGGSTHAWVFTGAALNHHIEPSIPDYRVPAERIQREPATLIPERS